MVPLSQPIGSKTKTIRDSLTNVFPRFAPRLHVFASSFDWFTGLSVSFVIGQSDFFGFATVNRKIALTENLAYTIN